MDRQATLIDRPRRESPADALTHSLASIAHDMVTIADLQVRLLAIDLRTLRQGVLRGLVMWGVACGLLIAVLPTALIGTGLWLADVAHLSTAAGLLWVAFGAMPLVVGLFLVGWRQISRQRVGLQRSRKELRVTLAAMRQVLSSHAGRDSED
jgi:uncharacterized membrane protein YqjE